MLVDWSQIEKYADIVADKVRKDNYVPDIIVGIGLSGLVPTTLISKALGLNNVATVSAYSYDGKDRQDLTFIHKPNADMKDLKVLLIDDIVASGQTLEKVSELLKKEYDVKVIKTATLIVSKRICKKYPDFYGGDVMRDENDWIKFPWDKYEL